MGSLSKRSLGGFITKGGKETVVVVVTVVTVCWVAGPKLMRATVECCGGMAWVVVEVEVVVASRGAGGSMVGMLSSVGEAGAVVRMLSGL